jgi:hypothetical protein
MDSKCQSTSKSAVALGKQSEGSLMAYSDVCEIICSLGFAGGADLWQFWQMSASPIALRMEMTIY